MSKYQTSTGNPNLRVIKTHNSASYARKALRKPVAELRDFAAKFNQELMERCDTLMVELGSLNLDAIPTGQTRRWELSDKPSGVTLVVEVEKL